MNEHPSRQSWRAIAVAVLVGLAGATVIWVATPYNNFVVGTSNISDGYLPAAALFLTLLLVMGVNPLLRVWRGGRGLSSGQLAIAVGVMLIACVLPWQGLLRALPTTLSYSTRQVSNNSVLAAEYEKMDLPPGLFPDPIGFGADTPASEGYLEELRPGESIPWSNWLAPLLTWGVFLLFCWLMMVGLGLIVFPQWRHNERLAFPLLTVQQSLLADPEPGRLLPPLLRRRSFWIAAGAVFLLHLLAGAKVYFPESVPAVPLDWNLGALFSEEPWRRIHVSFYANRLYFIFVGVAFFMPARISFSIWFFLVVYHLYRGLAPAYGVTQFIEKIDDFRFGAVLLLAGAVLWIGRAQWARVFARVLSRPRSEQDRRDRSAGRMFLAGLAGMFAWMVWAGVQPGWAAMLVGFAFIVSLLISRIVAETGMPFVRLYENPITLMKLFPAGWVGAASIYMAAAINMIFSIGGRASAAALTTHAIGLDPNASPRRQRRMGGLLLASLAVGLVIAGAANLLASYHHSTRMDGQSTLPHKMTPLDEADNAVMQLARGQFSPPTYNRVGWFAAGAGLAGGLYWLCLAVPQWPLHPFGLMLIDSYFGHTAWPSIFVGWLLQSLIVRFGGARLYRSARSVFLGLIIGEALAAIFWSLTPLAAAAAGLPFRQVNVLPG